MAEIYPPSSVAHATASPRGEAFFKIPFVFHNKDSERGFENLFVLINYLYLRIPLFLKAIPRNSDGEIAKPDFSSDNTKIRRL